MEKTKFTILGESLSGKTSYLIAMYSELSQTVAGYSIVAQDDNKNAELLNQFFVLDEESAGMDRFPQRTDQNQTYLFDLNYANKPIMPFEWIDYPGSLLRDANYGGYSEVAKTINESSTLFICVDGKFLVGNNTERKIKQIKKKCGITINPFLSKYFKEGGKLPPVGIILAKSDLFMNDTNEEEIRKILTTAFSPLFVSRETLIGVIPVTLGEHIQDNNYSGELYPVNVHLPIFMGIYFALKEQIAAYKYKIASNERSISDMDYWKRDEEDSFFIWRDDNKIRRLASNISDTKKENERMQQLIKSMENNNQKFEDYMNQILWFEDGHWKI